MAPQRPAHVRRKARHERARRTYAKLDAIWGTAWEDQRIRELSTMAIEASRRGDEAEAEKLEAEQMKVVEEVRAAELKKILDSPDESIDKEFAQRFVAFESVKPPERFKLMTAELGPRMGQLPMAGDNPVLGADRYSAQFGFASNEGLLVTVRSLHFADVSYGAPTFVDWLKQRGCVDFRYQFAHGGIFDGLDLDALEER